MSARFTKDNPPLGLVENGEYEVALDAPEDVQKRACVILKF